MECDMKAPIVAISGVGGDGLAELLAGRGRDVVILPDIYGLRPDSPALRALGQSEPLVLVSRLKPRAAFWTLRALGVDGRRTDSLLDVGEDHGRPILCVEFADGTAAEQLAGQLEALAGAPAHDSPTEPRRVRAQTEERWYPVIDYDRCRNCRECLEFCLFGVYDTDDQDRVVAADPEACKPGCPACSRVCPAAAIMFPLHASEPAIAGADEGTIRPLDAATAKRDMAAVPRESLTTAEVARACNCAPPTPPCDCQSGPAGSGRPCCDQGSANGEDRDCFDDLVQDLAEE
jgi:NAD-dependent dihydropyrimidine dehydrogenase PreA subunit